MAGQPLLVIGCIAALGFAISAVGAFRGAIENRPTAIVGAALFLIASAIAFK